MELQGTLVLKKDEQKITESFKKREMVIKTEDGQHSQEILLEMHQDRVDIIDHINVGDQIKCSINIRGKRFTKIGEDDRFFNTIIAWRVEKI